MFTDVVLTAKICMVRFSAALIMRLSPTVQDKVVLKRLSELYHGFKQKSV